MKNRAFDRAFRAALLTSVAGAAVTLAMPAAAAEGQVGIEEIVVTGSRIARANEISNSPIAVVTFDQIVANADVTLDTYLNSLPQVSPAGTTTSNNPGNDGQSNVDLRGLGANRNLVLVDGRRVMVSASDQTVDLNTIPQALIESIEIVTGGAGAVYGADAVAGAVNIKLKQNFEGIDVRAHWSDATGVWDSQEFQISGLLGGNFNDDRGNAIIAFDYSDREGLIKSQRPFAALATSTTSFPPTGRYFGSGNNPTQAAVDTVFARYGVAAGAVPAASNLIGFNNDGTLHGSGIFNSPIDAQNFKYPVSPELVNTSLYPDLYSFNFDWVNILVLPLERRGFMGKLNYEFNEHVEAFGSVGWTQYSAATALAPTPMPTVQTQSLTGTNPLMVKSVLVTPGATVANQLIVPTTNPFIPADLREILNSRTGNNASIVGTGATEPFTIRTRTLSAGLRQSDYTNTVTQYMFGLRGQITDTWTYEAYVSEGRTLIDQFQSGNIDTQRFQDLLEAADGGVSVCAGGVNPFTLLALSDACVDYLEVSGLIRTQFIQRIGQAYVTGTLAEMPAGDLSVALGVEHRGFEYELDPGSAGGPISGFNTQTPASGKNRFRDIFGEAVVPLMGNQNMVQSLELSLGYRLSNSKFEDREKEIEGDSRNDSTYKAELSWQPDDTWRVRGSYQRSVRAPNFDELFDGGGSAPSYFDPCSFTTNFRRSGGAQARALCLATGVAAPDSFVQAPGGQLSITTSGNTDLDPEKADTISVGAVFSSITEEGWLSRLRGSIDYYNINIKGAIITPDPAVLTADCYNFYGNNASLSATQANCQAVFRAGSDILLMLFPDDPDGNFPGINAGKIQASGVDLQLNYGLDLEELGASPSAGGLTFDLLLNYVLDFKQQESPGLPVLEYAGTVSYFGEGLGTSMPRWRGNFTVGWDMGMFNANLRTRYIGKMENRAARQFPGEDAAFTGTPAIWYFDIAAGVDITEWATIRAGLNNAFNKKPPIYAPNVQSGTDPSMFDVVGRRVFVQTAIKF